MAYIPMISIKYLGNGLAEQTVNMPAAEIDEIMRHRQESEFAIAELHAGQSYGRPEWQKGLPLHELEYLDKLADAAYRSNEGLKEYIAYTAHLRPKPSVSSFSGVA